MLPALFRVTDQEHQQLLDLADGKAPAGGTGALLSELGLVERKRATRIGMAFGAAMRLVEQIASPRGGGRIERSGHAREPPSYTLPAAIVAR